MSIRFYSAEMQPVAGPVRMLPQEGSISGGTKRPLNSYAIEIAGHTGPETVLFDAPFGWVMDALDRLHRTSPIAAHVLSHRDVAASADSFETQVERFAAPFLLHPADQAEPGPSRLSVPLGDPRQSDVLARAGIEIIHMPGHSPGSVMLHLPAHRILLAGDCAVGPGPEQEPDPPRLERPKMGEDEDVIFCDAFAQLIDRLPSLAAVLPLHGAWYLRSELGDAAFEHALENICEGAPMDPSGS